ncbi:hypothetical protein CONCODRAFT_71731 [Conidiobolus coronatus NRRL 28638]|uniref:GATA-type domain-containing protein n=1 Tax=Conidiobolus coronatus (strain ATCC 28846 / CBS 209.66 / NRRL 28638) TaxID=796925 RepID=A0A137P283_CONC2|nr:hypothetical protein CONCODRAFT_71731 [Conidiobolus coronatus NRRL 28638]|eukprot:KXN69122.1 hypothetical protein CONCODRAFT_71731 [Conidiobolus coronatus NRRL 28638]
MDKHAFSNGLSSQNSEQDFDEQGSGHLYPYSENRSSDARLMCLALLASTINNQPQAPPGSILNYTPLSESNGRYTSPSLDYFSIYKDYNKPNQSLVKDRTLSHITNNKLPPILSDPVLRQIQVNKLPVSHPCHNCLHASKPMLSAPIFNTVDCKKRDLISPSPDTLPRAKIDEPPQKSINFGTKGLKLVEAKTCENCTTTETPGWRRDKEGKQLLCNACGLYEKIHNIPRPVKVTPNGDIKVVRPPKLKGKKKHHRSASSIKTRNNSHFPY